MGDSMKFTATARRLGIFSAAATVILLVAYAVTLAVGLLSLESPQQPIADPMFSILEVPIIFMGLLAGVTCSLHFVILTLSRQPEFTAQLWLPLVLSFNWPSVAYALDILGWDVFFALSMLFAAPIFRSSRLTAWIRVLMIASGVLALAGLSGVMVGDMQIRNIGIVGYVGVFLIVAALLAVFFYRLTPK